MFLGPTLMTLGQLFKVLEGFLAQMSKVKCISNVLRNTFCCKPVKFFHIFQDPDDASVPGRLQDFQEEIILAT